MGESYRGWPPTTAAFPSPIGPLTLDLGGVNSKSLGILILSASFQLYPFAVQSKGRRLVRAGSRCGRPLA